MKVFLLTTERREKFQYIEFKELIITHALANFKPPSNFLTLFNTGEIPVMLLPTFAKVMNEYGFTNANTLTK